MYRPVHLTNALRILLRTFFGRGGGNDGGSDRRLGSVYRVYCVTAVQQTTVIVRLFGCFCFIPTLV